jgi:hypothetical protein
MSSEAMKEILPTHTCFNDALELLAELSRDCPETREGLLLVHAICTAPDGNHYAHAYVSNSTNGTSRFGGIFKGERVCLEVDTAEYEANLRIIDCVRYTVPQAIMLNHQSGHYGPWIERYRRLCSRSRKVYR